MDRATRIAAARRFAPPLIVPGAVDKRGARLRRINQRAVDYARNAGLHLFEIYPQAVGLLRGMAPRADSRSTGAFLRASGLQHQDVHFAGEPAARVSAAIKRIPAPSMAKPPTRWRWAWAAAGVIVGAVLGPVGAAAGGGLGYLGGGKWG